MISKYRSIIVSLACRIISPFIFIYGIYVIIFGHYSPGGGFQGGTILAADVILMRMVLGKRATYSKFPPRMGIILGAVGLIIYVATGLTTLLMGGNFLDYSYLPFGLTAAENRHYGILCVDIGIAFAVFGVLLSIFDSLSGEE